MSLCNCDFDVDTIFMILCKGDDLKTLDADGSVRQKFLNIKQRLDLKGLNIVRFFCFLEDVQIQREFMKEGVFFDGELTSKGQLVIYYSFIALRKIFLFRLYQKIFFDCFLILALSAGTLFFDSFLSFLSVVFFALSFVVLFRFSLRLGDVMRLLLEPPYYLLLKLSKMNKNPLIA